MKKTRQNRTKHYRQNSPVVIKYAKLLDDIKKAEKALEEKESYGRQQWNARNQDVEMTDEMKRQQSAFSRTFAKKEIHHLKMLNQRLKVMENNTNRKTWKKIKKFHVDVDLSEPGVTITAPF
jgi:hypothetical protein